MTEKQQQESKSEAFEFGDLTNEGKILLFVSFGVAPCRKFVLLCACFLRRPGPSILIILILALGIGANTAMFSIVNAVLIRPLPYNHSDRLVLVWQSSDQHRSTGEWFNTYAEFQEWQHHSRSFEKLGALTWAVSDKTLLWHGKAQNILAIPVSIDFFSMLEIRAAEGRVFEQSDLAQDCTVVLSHSFWQNQLGGPPGLVGESVPLISDQRECRVIGIMPRDFSFYPTQAALWMLITLLPKIRRILSHCLFALMTPQPQLPILWSRVCKS